jgi:hypothetical protein
MPPPEDIQTTAVEDGQDPSLEIFRDWMGFQAVVGGSERLLAGVLSVFPVSQDIKGQGHGRSPILIHHELEPLHLRLDTTGRPPIFLGHLDLSSL